MVIGKVQNCFGVEREREHEDIHREAMQDSPTLQALQQCGLLKFYCTSNMRANVCLLEMLIGDWDHELGLFDLQGEILEITVEDIYFITGLSRKGMPVKLEGIGRGGDPMSVQDCINAYCPSGTHKKGTCVPISQITSFPLQVIISTVERIVGSSSLHSASRTHMQVAVACMQGMVFDWYSGMISIM